MRAFRFGGFSRARRASALGIVLCLQLVIGTVTATVAHAAAPDAPTFVEAEQVAGGVVGVIWDAPASDGGSPLTSYTATASPGGNTCTTTDMTPGEEICFVEALTVGVSYTFTVVATNADGNSAASDPSSPLLVREVPGPPAVTGISNQFPGIGVHWSAPTVNNGPPITGYVATASPGGNWCSTTGLTCTISGLEPGTYSITVVAVNDAGESQPSPAFGPVAFTVPQRPGMLSVSMGSTTATAHWGASPPTAMLPISYKVTATPGGQSCTASTTRCTITGLTPGTSYAFTVWPSNALGEGTPWGPGPSHTTLDVPSAPLNVVIIPGTSAATIKWTRSVSTGGRFISGYDVTATGTGSGACSTTTLLSCAISGLVPNELYTFSVTARNSTGNSVAATVQSVGVDTIAPPSASALTGSTSVSNWGDPRVSVSFQATAREGDPAIRLASGGAVPTLASSMWIHPVLTHTDSAGVRHFTGQIAGFPEGPLAVSVFMLDEAGNASAPSSLVFEPSVITALRPPATATAARPAAWTWLLRDSKGVPRSGARVTAMVRTVGTVTWKRIPLVTDARGRVRLSLALRHNSQVQLQYAGGVRRATAVSRLTVTKVAPAITATLANQRVRRGRAMTLTGSVAPAANAQVVYLQVLVGRTWRNVTTTKTSRTGSYAFRLPTARRGSATYRVYKAADARNIAGASAPRLFTVL